MPLTIHARPTEAPQPTTTELVTLPAWANWRCPADDTLWDNTEGDRCWFCGGPGVVSPVPQITSQYGSDLDAAARERTTRPPAN